MAGGAHYTFNQNINFKKWEGRVLKLYNEIKAKENVVFVCHNKKRVQSY